MREESETNGSPEWLIEVRSSAPGAGAGPGREAAAEPARRRAMDETDHKIIRLLQRDARMSMRELAAAVHVSRANAYTRVSRLLDDGVIRGFTIQVDPERAGLGTSAYITLQIEQNSWREIRENLLALPWVEHVALVSGDFDAILLVRSASNRALRDLIFTHIQSMPGVRTTRTLLIFDETDHLPALPHLPG